MRVASLIIVAAVGTASAAFAQTEPSLNASSNYTQPVNSTPDPQPNQGGSNPSRPAKPDQDNADADVNDDSLYRGKTSEMETNLIRDEGPLHFKRRPKEKIQEVDSKKLFSSGTDPKFQGSFAVSGVSSIDKVAAKAEEASEPEPEEQGDPRFSGKHLTFKSQTDDKPKKAATDSSPSPTPSATASPAAKTSSAQKP
jgi:hypothetical protein